MKWMKPNQQQQQHKCVYKLCGPDELFLINYFADLICNSKKIFWKKPNFVSEKISNLIVSLILEVIRTKSFESNNFSFLLFECIHKVG